MVNHKFVPTKNLKNLWQKRKTEAELRGIKPKEIKQYPMPKKILQKSIYLRITQYHADPKKTIGKKIFFY